MCQTGVKTISHATRRNGSPFARWYENFSGEWNFWASSLPASRRRCKYSCRARTLQLLRDSGGGGGGSGIFPNRRGSCLVISLTVPSPRANWIRVNNFIKRVTRHCKLNYCRNWEQCATVFRAILFSPAEQQWYRCVDALRFDELWTFALGKLFSLPAIYLQSVVTSNKMTWHSNDVQRFDPCAGNWYADRNEWPNRVYNKSSLSFTFELVSVTSLDGNYQEVRNLQFCLYYI